MTVIELFRSDRYFKTWQYTVSHRRLILRSTRDNPPATRIDIHFGAVSLMLLRPHYDGLLIREATPDEHSHVADQYNLEVKQRTLFALGSGLTSFIVSGRPQWYEDEGGLDDPSWFGHMPGTP